MKNFCSFIIPFLFVDAGIFVNPQNANSENVGVHYKRMLNTKMKK